MTDEKPHQPKGKPARRVVLYLNIVGATIATCAAANGAWLFSLQSRILRFPAARDPGFPDYVSVKLKSAVFFVPPELAASYQMAYYVFYGIGFFGIVFLSIYVKYVNPLDKLRKFRP